MHKLFKYIAAFVLRKYIIQFVLFFIAALLSLSIYFFIAEKKRAKQELQAQAQMLELKNEISLQQVYLQLAGAASYGYAVSGDKATAAGLDMALDSIQASTLRIDSLCRLVQYKAGSSLCARSAALVLQKTRYFQLVKRIYDHNNQVAALNLASGLVRDHLSDSIQKTNSAILNIIRPGTTKEENKFQGIKNALVFPVIIGCLVVLMLIIYALFQYTKHVQQLNKQLEGKIDHISTNLEAVNNELDTFTFSVSQYLKAPLRAINRYAHILKKEYGPALDASANGSLDILLDSAGQISRLIDTSVKFSKLEKTEIGQSNIDMNTIVQDTLKELSATNDLSKYNIIIKPLSSCKGDSHLLKEVWHNLVENAIKFSRTASVPEIEIGCKTDPKERIYYVIDNGVGFDMIYQAKLFGIFQRLHRKGEFEGAGLGLSLVKRIVEKHGGRVFAESVVNKETTFFFTLPNIR